MKAADCEPLTRMRNICDLITGADEGMNNMNDVSEKTNVFRAVKDGRQLQQIIIELDNGGVVAILPKNATKQYENDVSAQLAKYKNSQISENISCHAGMLALPTSGTTGRSKLVLLPAERICKFLQWAEVQFDFSSATRSLSISPWNFDVSLLDTWAVLAAGGRVFTVQADQTHNLRYLRGRIQAAEPSFVQLVPSTLRAVIASMAGCEPLTCTRDVVLTGGVVSHADRVAAGKIFPYASFHNVYGSTEVNDCFIKTVGRGELEKAETLDLGQPLPGVKAYIQNDEGLHELGATTLTGELVVTTPWMAVGYINDGNLEPLPRARSSGPRNLYPTKDQVHYDGHILKFLGRKNRTVKVRGQRVNLDMIEQATIDIDFVAMAHAWVGEADGYEQLFLAYSAASSEQLQNKNLRLRTGLSQRLPPYAVPTKIYFYADDFPLNANGKPDGEKIRKSIIGEHDGTQ